MNSLILANRVDIVPIDVGWRECLLNLPVLEAKSHILFIIKHILSYELDLIKSVEDAVSVLEGYEGDAQVLLFAILLDGFHLGVYLLEAILVVLFGVDGPFATLVGRSNDNLFSFLIRSLVLFFQFL